MNDEMALEKTEKKELKNIIFDHGVIPKDYDDVMRFAGLVHGAGLAPKGFDTAAKCAIGILTNLEQGRPAITGLQDLAIINGRCGTFGNAITAKITASGLMEKDYPKETETGIPYEDDWKFTYTVKRKGRPEATGVWTWEDSKRAGFDKAHALTPWVRFTRRMMQWKARSFVNQDEFGDVLRGMVPVEDLYDIVEMEPGRNGTFTTPEQKAADLTEKIKDKPDYTPKEVPGDPAEALKKKLEDGDKGIEDYQDLKVEEKPTVDPLTGEPLEEGEPKGTLPDNVDQTAWLTGCRPTSSIANAKAYLATYKEHTEAIGNLDNNTLKAKLKFKAGKAEEYLSESLKTKEAVEEPPAHTDNELPAFEQGNNELDEVNGRVDFLSAMKKYMDKNLAKYTKVLKDNSTEDKPLDGWNDVEPGDQDAILEFMRIEFAKED